MEGRCESDRGGDEVYPATFGNEENNRLKLDRRYLEFDSRAGQISAVSLTVRHRCDVSLELRCPGAKPRRWTRYSFTRFAVIPRRV